MRLIGGTLHVQRDYEETPGCNLSVDAPLEIAEGRSNDHLTFDLSGAGIALGG